MPDFDKQHRKNAYKYTKELENKYVAFADKVAKIADNPKAKFQKSFKFSNNKEIQKLVDEALGEFNSGLYDSFTANITDEWLLANVKNDALVKATIKSAEVLLIATGLTDHNIKALDAFLSRKVDGMNLSERVWKEAKVFKDELEIHLQIGIANGDSAAVISRRVRENLLEPDKLFRRVRDNNGNLVLSQRAKEYKPGQGVYRSSFKNARRMTVTETNMAYRNADHLRWKNNPTIVGFEVKLSGSHPATDICDDLKGKYPKSFLFTGWHPHCFCYATPIMLNDKEFDEYIDCTLSGKPFDSTKSANYISETTEGFGTWMKSNENRIIAMSERGTVPYFIRDNFKGGKIEGGLSWLSENKKLDIFEGIKIPEKLLRVEQKYNYGEIDIQKYVKDEINKEQLNIKSFENQIEVYKKQLSEIGSNQAFDTYTKNFKPNEAIPKTIERDSGTFELFESKKDMFSPKIIAEYRKYKADSTLGKGIERKIEQYESKISEANTRLGKLKASQLNSEIESSVLNKLRNERADKLYYKFVADDDLIPDLADNLKNELKVTNSFRAKSTNTQYIETKYGKIRISDHDSRFEQDSSMGSKVTENRPVEFDIEDHNVIFTKDKSGFYVKVNDIEYYVHEYNINSREDLIEFASTKLKRQIADVDSRIGIADLKKIYSFDEETAIEYLSAKTAQEKAIIDIVRISKMDNLAGKIAKTIINNDFKSISPKQADILFQYSVEEIDVTLNYIKKAEKYLENARYRQAGSSLRK